MGHYHAQMSAKHSYVSFALLNILASRMIPAEVRKEVIATIQTQANRLFGPNPDIPEMILMNREGNDQDYIRDMFDLFDRCATNRWASSGNDAGCYAWRRRNRHGRDAGMGVGVVVLPGATAVLKTMSD